MKGIIYDYYRKYIVFCVIYTIVILFMIFVLPYVENLAGITGGDPTACEIINIKVHHARTSEYVTTFISEENDEIRITSSYGDYIGRKTVLYVFGEYGFRKKFEVTRLTFFDIILICTVVFAWGIVLHICISIGDMKSNNVN